LIWNNQGLLSSTSELAALLEGEADGGIHNWRHPELVTSTPSDIQKWRHPELAAFRIGNIHSLRHPQLEASGIGNIHT